jgi:type I restriction enzyme S subunit
VDEQKRIMAQLDFDLSGLNTAIARLEREIRLLREYRARLVADVVTGKLDVRAAAGQLPEAAGEAGAEPAEITEAEVDEPAEEETTA